MRVTFTQPAPPNSRFAPDSWNSQVGKRHFPVHTGRGSLTGTLVAATVVGDGTSVELTIDILDPPTPPVDPHLLLPNGDTVRLIPAYAGQDNDGIHQWDLTPAPEDQPKLDGIADTTTAKLIMDTLPAHTRCFLTLAPRDDAHLNLDEAVVDAAHLLAERRPHDPVAAALTADFSALHAANAVLAKLHTSGAHTAHIVELSDDHHAAITLNPDEKLVYAVDDDGWGAVLHTPTSDDDDHCTDIESPLDGLPRNENPALVAGTILLIQELQKHFEDQ